MSDDMIPHSLEIAASRARRHTGRSLLVGTLVVAIALGLIAYFHTTPVSSDVTAYSHTGVLGAGGIAAQGKYVWIADAGVLPQGPTGINHGEKVVRVDAATGAATSITSPLFSDPFAVVATGNFVWVLNQGFVSHRYSLLRLNEATLAVTKVILPTRIKYEFDYSQGGYVVAGGCLWISTTEGIVRVNTSTLAVSRITSPLLTGGPYGSDMVADAHYVWLSESLHNPGSPLPRVPFLIRVSINTGSVTKFTFPGMLNGWPIADDGKNLWIEDTVGLQRFNLKSGRETLVTLPDGVGLPAAPSGLGVVANGSVYLAADANANTHQGEVVRVRIASGRVSIVSSPYLKLLNGVTAANGVVWADNWPAHKLREPVLVRVS